MKNENAKRIAEKYLNILKPYCTRIEIAGSIRREKPEVGDIELIAIVKDIKEFSKEVNKLEKVKGNPTGKYTQRILPEGIKLDLFMANIRNWGLIFAIRTGSARYSHEILACGWVKRGYKSINGILTKNGREIEVREEKDLFNLIGVAYVQPNQRF